MRKIFASTVLCLLLCLSIVMPTLAQKVTMNGYADPDAIGVSILITNKAVGLDEMQPEDIVWIDQQKVNADGSFSLSLPLYLEEGYTIYSSAQSITDGSSESSTVFVSANGTGHGLDAMHPTNLASVYNMLAAKESVTAVLTEDVTFSASRYYNGKLTIKGKSGNEKLNMTSAVALTGDLTIDNLVLSASGEIYAGGYELVITDKVTTTNNLTVYGGSRSSAVNGDTSLKLYGGNYQNVYGGGKYAAVNGNTNVVFGGNATALKTSENASYQCIYGGGNDGAVTGKTNVTFEGNAKADYIVGAGVNAGGTATDTNITITGGQVMNVYGGSRAVALTNCNTHITMTGGKAEALFGGCESVSMSGNTYITVKGGEVTRRIYGGCYNEAEGLFSLSWVSDNHVTGTTNIFIYPNADVITGSGLSGTNAVNKGIFAGSRRKSSSSDEINTIYFMDGSYSAKSSKVGEQGFSYKNDFKSFHNYMVNSAANGTVIPAGTGFVEVDLPQGRSALAGGKRYFDGDKIALTQNATTEIKYDGITSVQTTETSTGVDAIVGVDNSTPAELIAAIYDEEGNLITYSSASVDTTTKSYELNLNCNLEKGKQYSVKFYMWQDYKTLVPVTKVYNLQLV